MVNGDLYNQQVVELLKCLKRCGYIYEDLFYFFFLLFILYNFLIIFLFRYMNDYDMLNDVNIVFIIMIWL